MIIRFFLAMLSAGLLAGLLITPVQYARVVPLILHAETFEGEHDHAAAGPQLEVASPGDLAGDDNAVVGLQLERRFPGAVAEHKAAGQQPEASSPSRIRAAPHAPAAPALQGFVAAAYAAEQGGQLADGSVARGHSDFAATSEQDGQFSGGSVILAHSEIAAAEDTAGGASRLVGTLLANLVTGAGFALVLAAASLFTGIAITPGSGVLWGLAGFSVVALAPALGLPPELPAMPAADLVARQAWWAATVALTAAGIFALVRRPEPWAKALGVLLIALPHLYGAPRPGDLSSPMPPTLAAEFAVASLATAAAFWIMLGAIAGTLLHRARIRDTGMLDAGPA